MNALWFLACLAAASAGPMRAHFDPFASHGNSEESLFGGDVFDTRRFWQEMESEMHKFDEMMNEFYKHFPSTSSAGIKGNEYIITVNLIGYDEEDIKVKAKEGVLMIQAVHSTDDGSQSSYLDLKTLPSYVNVNGSWTYDAGVLRIVFPLNRQPSDVTEVPATEIAPTEADVDVRNEQHSREEMDNSHHGDANQDADVGLQSNNNDNEILTNVIARENTVEATTYAVDLKNEVEFVPVKY